MAAREDVEGTASDQCVLKEKTRTISGTIQNTQQGVAQSLGRSRHVSLTFTPPYDDIKAQVYDQTRDNI